MSFAVKFWDNTDPVIRRPQTKGLDVDRTRARRRGILQHLILSELLPERLLCQRLVKQGCRHIVRGIRPPDQRVWIDKGHPTVILAHVILDPRLAEILVLIVPDEIGVGGIEVAVNGHVIGLLEVACLIPEVIERASVDVFRFHEIDQGLSVRLELLRPGEVVVKGPSGVW